MLDNEKTRTASYGCAGRSGAGGELLRRGGREVHLLQEGLEAGVGAEGVENKVGPDGAFYVATWGRASPSNTIYRVTQDGEVSIFVEGQGIGNTQPMAFDDAGYLYVGSPISGTIHRVSPAGEVEPFVELAGDRAVDGSVIGDMVHHSGVLYVTAFRQRKVLRVDIQTREVTVLAGSGEQATRDGVGEEAAFGFPWGLAISRDGRELWVSVVGVTYDRIRKIELGPRSRQTAANVAGAWALTAETDLGTRIASVILEQNRTELTGHFSSSRHGEAEVRGSVNGNEVEFSLSLVVPLLVDLTYTGTVQDDGTLSGQVSLGLLGGGTFTGNRR